MRSIMTALQLLVISTAALPSNYKREVSVDTRTLEEIYEAAQKEDGFLNIAWGGDAHDQGVALPAAFEAAFPLIKVNLTVDLSKYQDSHINRAYAAHDTSFADVTGLQTVQDFDDWKAAGRLLAYKPPTWNDFWPQFKDAEGYYMSFTCFSAGTFTYDNTKVAAEDVPQSYQDLLDSKWKGKMVVTYPNDDDAINAAFRLIILRYGWAWLEAFIAQDVQWVRGTQSPADVILQNGTRILSISTFPVAATLSSVQPVNDEFLIWPQTIGILNSTTRPETAKLWLAWLTSDTVQKGVEYDGWSSRSDIPPSVFSYHNADPTGFHMFMSDRKDVEQWRFQFESFLGTPQGPSPLTFSP